ncbi:hypothetical protein AMK59_1604, partial [Oryctes borbonicus]
MSATNDNNNTQLNESIETNCDISLPLLRTYGESKPKPSLVSNNEKKKNNLKDVDRHEYFLPPMLYSYGPNECGSDIDLVVLSLLQNDDEVEKEMDTSRDMDEAPPTPRPQIRINNLSSIIKESQETPPPINEYCNCKNYARAKNGELLKCPKATIYFNDGLRSVDFILVWDAYNDDATSEEAYYKRRIFEENLMKDGVEIEYEDPEKNGLNFIKLHAPKEVLRRYGE